MTGGYLGNPGCGSMIDIVIILTIIHVRLGVNHRVATGIFGSHPASEQSDGPWPGNSDLPYRKCAQPR